MVNPDTEVQGLARPFVIESAAVLGQTLEPETAILGER
jgi:hypothetical protein